MTQDDIISMARAAGWLSEYDSPTGFCAEIAVKFAHLIAVHTRKELAKEFAGLGEWTCVHIIESIDEP